MKNKYRNGQIIEGLITGIQPYGAFVELEDGVHGLIHISEISDDYVRDIRHFLNQGENVIAKIMDVGDDHAQLRLSLKALNYSSRKNRSDKEYKRPLVPKMELGFDTLDKLLPGWIHEKENMMVKVNLEYALFNYIMAHSYIMGFKQKIYSI